MSGEHEIKIAKHTGLKEAMAIGLDEALTALEESISDLTDEQVRAFPVANRANIAWIVMHSLMNLNHCACYAQTGRSALEQMEDRWDYQAPRAGPEQDFPSQRELMDMLKRVREQALQAIAEATADELTRPRDHWADKTVFPTDHYIRTIFHSMAHIRQIWLLRGALGLTDGTRWPRQHWA